MEWGKLLSQIRIREASKGPPSLRSSAENRDEFERDYGRALYSTPVRRLKDKAQVFPLEQHDSVRTRLAHSLEVSSVARNLASTMGNWLLYKGLIQHGQDVNIQNIAATCGLVHDLGNPPFGHAGELAISSWFERKRKGEPGFFEPFGGENTALATDFIKFEGNAQTLRLLSHLQILADPHGLNLTCGTFSAACKYVAPSNVADRKRTHVHKKPGYFESERKIVELVRTATGTEGARNPITFLVEAADDIVYSTVDLEDGIKKGVIEWALVQQALEKTVLGKKALDLAHAKVDGAQLQGRPLYDALAQAFRTFAISELAGSVIATFIERYALIMNGEYEHELITDVKCAAKDTIAVSKDLLKRHLYTFPQILSLEVRGRRVIHDLMDLFWEAAELYDGKTGTDTYEGKLYLLISENYRRVFEKMIASGPLPHKYYRLQLVTDHVSGMTDTHACRVHKELTNGA